MLSNHDFCSGGGGSGGDIWLQLLLGSFAAMVTIRMIMAVKESRDTERRLTCALSLHSLTSLSSPDECANFW